VRDRHRGSWCSKVPRGDKGGRGGRGVGKVQEHARVSEVSQVDWLLLSIKGFGTQRSVEAE
jgi:hypothetical protein